MEGIQLAIADASYRNALKELLVRDGTVEVTCVDAPDPDFSGVIVVDSASLERLPPAVRNRERVVLITQNEPQCLSRAWEAGIASVVFDKDPLSTVLLAIMAARLRVAKEVRSGPSAAAQAPGVPSRGGQREKSRQ